MFKNIVINPISILVFIIVLLSILFFETYPPYYIYYIETNEPPSNFIDGVLDGFLFTYNSIVMLFKSGVNVYDVHNNGIYYNLGYVLGNAGFWVRIRQMFYATISIKKEKNDQ